MSLDPMEPNERLRALFAKGEQVDINYGVPVRRYFRSCQELIRMAGIYYDEENLENSYILYAKFIILSFEKLKQHPDYIKVPVSERKANKISLRIAFKRAEELKLQLRHKYQEAYNKQLEEKAQMVALEREREIERREDEQRKKKEEEKREEERRKKSDQDLVDAFILAEEQKKLEDERREIEAKFGEKDVGVPLIQIDDAAPIPASTSLSSRISTSQIVPHPPIPAKRFHPQIPSRDIKPPVPDLSRPSIDRSLKPTDFNTSAFGASLVESTNKYGLRTILCPEDLPSSFLKYAASNTSRSIETCGVLFGKLASEVFVITHILIPHQKGAPDSCDTTREEDMWDFQDQYNGICLGWIHTHPTQTAFLSSVDLHTHYPYQCLMPESIAIVCSGKFNEIGYFMLTPDHGMNVIGKCRQSGFHPHQTTPALFEDCDHVKMTRLHQAQVVDWRNK